MYTMPLMYIDCNTVTKKVWQL